MDILTIIGIITGIIAILFIIGVICSKAYKWRLSAFATFFGLTSALSFSINSDPKTRNYVNKLFENQSDSTITHTLTFNPNGGTGGNSSQVFTRVPTDNECIVVEGILDGGIPTRAGYTFICWNTRSDGSGWDNYNGKNTSVSRSDVLYAVWVNDTDLNKRYIRFNANFERGDGSKYVYVQTFANSTERQTLNGEPIPTLRPGYKFLYWSTRPDGYELPQGHSDRFERNEAKIYMTKNGTLYAIWE